MQAESKVKSLLIIFFEINKIVHKEFLVEGQTVNSAHYCDVLRQLRKNERRFAPNFGDKKLAASHFLFHKGIFYQTHNSRLPSTLIE
jgi:hypothetical protein